MVKKLGYRMPVPLWEKMEKLLPERINTHRFGGGRPRRPDKDCADAIFFLLRTGCQWSALDDTGLCPHSTAHDRFQQWVRQGVWQRLWKVAVEEYDQLRGLDWSYLCVDGTMGKAPLGGEKNRAQPHRPQQAGKQTKPADRSRRRAPGFSLRRSQHQ